ncbi:PAS domain-containing sensor histidine kinase [Marinobacterium nitratireducens]|uniref:C4-dicarboxylate transport sensor protein DctB n=1 Tax=Marinobacterium nitratireducens TaxID=518897 RepID=A0A918DWN6_9GAMM|nr:ATP-binding protein [Marinobacterium nitratireducens]GGO87868.1 PAS domain-containing sensor histidine kinase [Marinobacterium nitratireducens]
MNEQYRSERADIASRRLQRPLVVLLLLLLFVFLMAQVAVLVRQQAMHDVQQRSAADMSRYTLTLQQKLDRYKDLPQLLSSHSELLNALLFDGDNDARMRANLYLEEVNQTIGTTDVYLMNAEGATIAASNWAQEKTFVGRNFSFRPYFKTALEGQAGRYFALGTTSNRRGYFYSYPVRFAGKVAGVVVVKIDLNDIEGDWNDPLLDILVTDEDGVIVISTRPEWKFRTLKPLTQGELHRIIESLRYGAHELTSLDILWREERHDGSHLITLFEGSRIDNAALDGVRTRHFLLQTSQVPNSGLSVAVLASMKPVEQRVFRALVLTAIIYLAGLLLVLVLVARNRIKQERARFRQRELLALEENESRIRAIIDNTQAGLITLDAQGRIESFNPTAEKLFRYREAEISGQYFSHLLAHPDRPVCWRHITGGADDTARELHIEASARRADQSQFPIELTIGRMPTDGQRHFIVTIHDITERKQHESQLQRAQLQLESRVEQRTRDLTRANARLQQEIQQHHNTQNELIQTAKLAVLGQMSAGINHELNQPLTAIRSYADNARIFLERGRVETAQANLDEISSLTERMAKIIHPLKEFARVSSGAPEPVCLQSARDGAMSILYGRLSHQTVGIHWPDGLDSVYVLGDMLRLEQVLVNLIGNALHALEGRADARIDIELERLGDEVLLSVRDNGPGLAPEHLDRLFEPFFTTKKAGQGLGLGLSISHRIIESLGGRLEARNHPGGGACFTIVLQQVPQPSTTE